MQTKGYAGADCLQASKFLEQALGVVAADSKTRRIPPGGRRPSSRSGSSPTATTDRSHGPECERTPAPVLASSFIPLIPERKEQAP